MATHAANVYREAELRHRLTKAANLMAERRGIAFPPPFPHAHDEHYRRNDEMERVVRFLEAVNTVDGERMAASGK